MTRRLTLAAAGVAAALLGAGLVAAAAGDATPVVRFDPGADPGPSAAPLDAGGSSR